MRWIAILLCLWTAALTARAQSRPFVLGGVEVELDDITADTAVHFRSVRPAIGRSGWFVDAVVSNRTSATFTGPFLLRFVTNAHTGSGIVGTSRDRDGIAVLDVTAQVPDGALGPGALSRTTTLELGRDGAAPVIAAEVYARRPSSPVPLLVIRTFGGDGLPAGGVVAEEIGPVSPRRFTSGRGGWLTLEGVGPVKGWKFTAPGTRPGFRTVPPGLRAGVTDLGSVRLAPANGVPDPQSLPAPLPRGWSPVAQAELPAGPAVLAPAAPVSSAEPAVLAAWDPVALAWRAESVRSGNGAGTVDFGPVPAGLHVFVVPDDGEGGPGPARAGEPLPAGTASGAPDDTLAATASATPSARLASADPQQATGVATVVFRSSRGPLPSGAMLRCEVTEEYRMRDGTLRVLPSYSMSVAGYRRPGAGDGSLTARFPLRPVQLLGGDALSAARVHVDVLVPGAFAGGVLDPRGGAVAEEPVRVTAPAGATRRAEAALVRTVEVQRLSGTRIGGVPVLAFELGVGDTGALVFDPTLRLPASQPYVLSRAVFDGAVHGWQPVGRYETDASGRLRPAEPATGTGLAGIDGGGLHVLSLVSARQAVVSGVARDAAGRPAAGLVVGVGPWTALSGADGGWRLLAPAGAGLATVSDPRTGDTGEAAFAVGADLAPAGADLGAAPRGPRIVRVDPADGAVDVGRSVSVTLVFDQPVSTATVVAPGAVQLRSGADLLPASVSLNAARTVLTLSPGVQLPAGTAVTVSVARTVSDPGGLALEGPNEFRFTTAAEVLRRNDLGLVIHEPLGGMARMTGGAGIADARQPVILVNESTGATATVLSGADGAFDDRIPADKDDTLSAVLVNANGTRTVLPAVKQLFRDGSVGLFASGGTVTAVGETGEIRLAVDPGAAPVRAILRLDPMKRAEFTALTGGVRVPEAGPFLGAFTLTESDGALNTASHLSFPVRVADMGLPPGTDPTNAVFGVVSPVRIDGVLAYLMVDTATYVPEGKDGGRVVTQSPPFTGVLSRALAALRRDVALPALPVTLAETIVNPAAESAVFAILPLAYGEGMKVAGKVTAVPVDASGQPSGDARPVPGAVVRVLSAVGEGRAVTEGTVMAISDTEGRFGFFYSPGDIVGARALLGTSARYPFQVARSGGFAVTDRRVTAVARVELRFADIPTAVGAVDGSGRPVLRLSVDNPVPRTGTAAGAGAVVTAEALDDGTVAVPTLAFAGGTATDGTAIDRSEVVVTALTTERTAPGRVTARFRVTSTRSGQVRLGGAVADDASQQDLADLVVSFGGARAIGPDPSSSDRFGPRVISSWPPDGATNLPALTPIRIRLNEPVPSAALADPVPAWVSLDGAHKVVRVEPSADRREVTVYYSGSPSGEVRLTFGTGLQDAAGNDFDQEPGPGLQAFTTAFHQVSPVPASLPDLANGGGVVLLGRYAYAIDRAGTSGRLVSYDLADPANPVKVTSQVLPDLPTSLSLVRRYDLPVGVTVGADGKGTFTKTATRDLLAVFTGSSTQTKRLRLVEVADGQMVPGAALGLDGGNIVATPGGGTGADVGDTVTAPPLQVVKSRWDPPFLGYFSLGADATSVTLLDLTAFDIAARRGGSLAAFPLRGDPGLDANGDGDYVDAGDRVPLPARNAFLPPGLAFSHVPSDARDRIQDFDFDAGLALVATVNVDASGRGLLRVALAATTNSLTNAVVAFAADLRPKRVLLLPAQTLAPPGGTNIVRDLALVSHASLAGGDGAVDVVDLSDPSAPRILAGFRLPAGEGAAQSVERRADGLLALATARNVLLIDPRRLGEPAVPGVDHPAIVGRIEGTGTGVRSFVAEASGVNVTAGGAVRPVRLTAPGFSLVRFNAVVNPADIAAQPASQVERFLRSASDAGAPAVMLAGSETEAPPADPNRHYYVRVRAPGGDVARGKRLPLVLVAVDRQGRPQVEKGGTRVPAVVGDSQLYGALLVRRVVDVAASLLNLRKAASSTTSLLARLQAASSANLYARLRALGDGLDRFPSTFEAVRLSDNPNEPLYNEYLAGPFVVLGGAPTGGEVAAMASQAKAMGINRAYLRPSPALWVGLPSRLDTDVRSDPRPLDPFNATLRLNPSLSVAGIQIPESGKLVTALAGISSASPASFLDPTGSAAVLVQALNNVPLVNLVLKGQLQPVLLPGAHLLVREAYNDRPLVLVPGFGASRLVIDGKERWLGIPFDLGNREKPELALRPDGSSEKITHVTDMLRYAVPIADLKPIYGTWVEHMVNELGYVEYNQFPPGGATLGTVLSPELPEKRRRLDGEPLVTQDPIPDLFVFPYDWRTDNQRSAEKLREYVRVVREIHPDADGIDLVCHSNGGLVGRAYMLLPGQRDLVRRFVTVGTPWLGAPKALAGLVSGDLDQMALNVVLPIRPMRDRLQFFPGVHQLLPGKEFFELGYRPLLEDGFDVNTNGVSHEVYGYPAYADSLGRHLLRGQAASAGFPLDGPPAREHPARNNSERFRSQSIADHRLDPPGVETHHIAGLGATPDTIGQVRVVGRLILAPSTNVLVSDIASGDRFESEQDAAGVGRMVLRVGDGAVPVTTNQYRLNREAELRYVAGDNTVPIGSLTRGRGSSLDYNAPDAQVHVLVAGYGEDGSRHNPMLNTGQFLRLFDDIMTGRKVEHLDVAVSVPDVEEGKAASFTVTASGAAVGEGNLSYVVDYGDGSVELRRGKESQSLSHTYRQSGTYLVCVGVTTDNDDSGRPRVTGFTSRRVVVRNLPPTVKIEGGNLTVNAGDTRLLVARVTDAGLDDTHTFDWDLPDKSGRGLHGFAVPATFTVPGTHTVRVTARDPDGATGTDSITVTVIATPATTPPQFPETARPGRGARPADLPGFEGGQPEILVRVVGNRPAGDIDLETPWIVVDNDRGGDGAGNLLKAVGDTLDSSVAVLAPAALPAGEALAAAAGDAYRAAMAALVEGFTGLRDNAIGKAAADADYVRVVRSRTLPLVNLEDVAGVDMSVKRTTVAAAGKGGPLELDVLLLKGGTPQLLMRWSNSVAASQGVRLKFDWVNEVADLEVSDISGGSLLTGPKLSNALPAFVALGPERAGDRSGPAVVGVLNPLDDRIHLVARDNFTPAGRIQLLLAVDANGNGRFEDDVVYELSASVLDRVRLGSRPFTVFGRDQAGNLGELVPLQPVQTRNYTFGEKPGDKDTYRTRLAEIRDAVRRAVVEALADPVVQRFVVSDDDLWLFEQGSGAGLWKGTTLDQVVDACNEVYIPGKSDNDYQIFLPSSLTRPWAFNAADRAEFDAADPLSTASLEGDWYFRPPRGVDAQGKLTDDPAQVAGWRYTLPGGLLNRGGEATWTVAKRPDFSDLSAGFPTPLPPAHLVARRFAAVLASDPVRAKLLEDCTFFANRREHFMYGLMPLDHPEAAGSDPYGDVGMGRQMLLLKWLLEGAFVTMDDSGKVQPGGLNASMPLQGQAFLDAIYANWASRDIPVAEGFEWGVLQELGAWRAEPNLYAEPRYPGVDPQRIATTRDDAVTSAMKSKVKKLGKAAIRGALARLAGDAQLGAELRAITPSAYRAGRIRSFEDYILATVRGSTRASGAFGNLAEDLDDLEHGPDLADWLRAKKADPAYLKLMASDPGLYARYARDTIGFLRTLVQAQTEPAYDGYMASLKASGRIAELASRADNLNFVLNGGGPNAPGLLDLSSRTVGTVDFPATATSYGPGTFAGVDLNGVPGDFNAGGVAGRTAEVDGDDPAEAEEKAVFALSDTAPDAVLGLGGTVASEPPATHHPAGARDIAVAGRLVGIPPSSLKPKLHMALMLWTPGETEEPFGDHAAVGGNARSVKFLVNREQRITARVWGLPANAIPSVIARSPAMGVAGRSAEMALDPVAGQPGVFAVANPAGQGLRLTGNPGDLASLALYVRDEEPCDFRLVGPGVTGSAAATVLVDRAEIAIGSLQFADITPNELLSKFEYRDRFVRTPNRFNYDVVGFKPDFPDTFALSDLGTPRDFSAFIQGFGDPALAADMGEADILVVAAHGSDAGGLFDHVVTRAPAGTRTKFFSPVDVDVKSGEWTRDAEVAIFISCNVLAEAGAAAYQSTLGSTARTPRILLGFQQPVSYRSQVNAQMRFLAAIAQGQPFVEAWREVMREEKLPWAMVYKPSAARDTVRRLGPRKQGPEAYIRESNTDAIPQADCDDVLGAAVAAPGKEGR